MDAPLAQTPPIGLASDQPAESVGAPAVSPGLRRAMVELTKPGITRLVTITSAVGFTLGALNQSWQTSDLVLRAFACVVGTALSASGANTLNQWWERDRDSRMPRTARRPLPQGRLSPQTALLLGLLLSLAGLLVLSVAGLAPAAVSLVTIVTYVLVYTPLKPVTTLNTLVGAIPGALPPLIGWTAAATGNRLTDHGTGFASLLQPGGWSLVILMIVWQIPHFLAIAWMYRDDYAKGGYRMLPILDESGRATASAVLMWSVALIPATIAPAWLMPDRLGWVYALIAGLSGLGFLWMCVRLARTRTRTNARAVFFASIIHLPVLLCVMVAEALFIAWRGA